MILSLGNTVVNGNILSFVLNFILYEEYLNLLMINYKNITNFSVIGNQ